MQGVGPSFSGSSSEGQQKVPSGAGGPTSRAKKVLADAVTVALVERVLNQAEQISALEAQLAQYEERLKATGARASFFSALTKFIIDYFRAPPRPRT